MNAIRNALLHAALLVVVLATAADAAFARDAEPDASRATLTLHLNTTGLASWRIDASLAAPADAPSPTRSPRGYATTALPARRVDGASAGARPDAPDDTLAFTGTLRFTRGDATVVLRDPVLRAVDGRHGFLVADRDGIAYLAAEMPHRHPPRDGVIAWRHLDLRALPALADALHAPRFADQLVGALDLVVDAARAPAAMQPRGTRDCRETLRWPSPAFPADLQLADISAVFAMRCDGCDATSTAGDVVFAPNAELVNVGDADIPWLSKFSAASPPYGNDQHPFLVWALYRTDADGRFEQLARSGAKHAFYAQNDDCDCAADVILYRGCSDLYSAFTNDSSDDLGPRREILPRDGIWARCGSIYDANCDGSFDPGAGVGSLFAERLVANEAELLPALNAGASFLFEAWYLVRDDANLDNSFGTRVVVPGKTDGAWTMAMPAPIVAGPAIDRWVARDTLATFARASRLVTADGRAQLAVRVTPLPGDRFRFDYALMNLDYARTTTTGAVPNLRALAQEGLSTFAVPLAAGATVTDAQFVDGDADAANDWTFAVAGDTARWSAPAGTTLGWGALARLSFVVDAGPVAGPATIGLAPSSPVPTAIAPVIVPRATGYLFADAFE